MCFHITKSALGLVQLTQPTREHPSWIAQFKRARLGDIGRAVGVGDPAVGNEKLIVELKAISGELGASEEQQLRNYMTILNVQRGMLINFQQPGRKQGKTKLDIRELAL
jgi:hypothetical protein